VKVEADGHVEIESGSVAEIKAKYSNTIADE